jgi:hypothetical protein
VLAIVDDYSRYSEIACLKSKGDVAAPVPKRCQSVPLNAILELRSCTDTVTLRLN